MLAAMKMPLGLLGLFSWVACGIPGIWAADPPPDLVWTNLCDFGVEGRGWSTGKSPYDRLPAQAEATVPKAVWELSHQSAGLCSRFTTTAKSIQVRWKALHDSPGMPHMPATGSSGIDFYGKSADGRWSWISIGRPQYPQGTASFGVPGGAECLLYLPLYNGIVSIEIGIPPGEKIACVVPKQKPIVFYGTSITQGACASRPGLAYAAQVGRRLNRPIINLGFSGSGKMEPALAELIAELDSEVLVVDCMWNMSPEEVDARVAPFIEIVRKKHPALPILLVEDYNFRNAVPTIKGRKLRAIADQLSKSDPNVHFLSGQDMLGSDTEASVDAIHPNDIGMLRLADAYVPALQQLLPKPSN